MWHLCGPSSSYIGALLGLKYKYILHTYMGLLGLTRWRTLQKLHLMAFLGSCCPPSCTGTIVPQSLMTKINLRVEGLGLILRILHDGRLLDYKNALGLGYVGSCRTFTINCRTPSQDKSGLNEAIWEQLSASGSFWRHSNTQDLRFRVWRFSGQRCVCGGI